MKDVTITLLLIAALGCFAAFIDERAEKYETRRALDRVTHKLYEKDAAALHVDKRRPRKY